MKLRIETFKSAKISGGGGGRDRESVRGSGRRRIRRKAKNPDETTAFGVELREALSFGKWGLIQKQGFWGILFRFDWD